MHKYIASIVMAVYNVEPYLAEAIESVIAQNIGFKNIQLILVDDGSSDGSPAICDEYAARYPDNIVVVHKENGGVSAARNEGLKHVEGQYVNFLDSDDLLSPNTVTAIHKFFELNGERTDVAAFPMYFFEGSTGEHALNYKFSKGNRVIDLDKEWHNPQLSMSSTFIKSEVLKEFCFDTRLAFAEDAQVMQKVLLKKCTLGVVKNAKYMYRRRTLGEMSAIQSGNYRPERYNPYMRYFQQETVDYCMNTVGYLPRFVQFTLMYDMQWRFKQDEIPEGVLSEEEEQAYRQALVKMLYQIDDDVIMAQRNIFREHKFYVISQKYDGNIAPVARDNDVVFAFPGGSVHKMSECRTCLEFLTPEESGILLEGSISIFCYPWENMDIYIRANGNCYLCTVEATKTRSVSLGKDIQQEYFFKCYVPLDKEELNAIDVVLNLNGVNIPISAIAFRQFFPVDNKYANAYARRGDWVIWPTRKGIQVISAAKANLKEMEWALRKEIWKTKKYGGWKAAVIRTAAMLISKLKRRPLWIISDRASAAGDNGEAFFRYMRKSHPEIDSRFAICKDNPDYQRMKKIGPVLDRNSLWYRVLVLACDRIISSQAEVEVYNPFWKHDSAYHDILCDKPFVFLQHGVTKDDLSSWLKRRNKNLAGFVTVAAPEYNSIIDGDYGYTDRQVWKTGFPRFDRLYHDEKKQIAIMPTWRKYLMGSFDRVSGKWTVSANFCESTFFRFYDQLINHPRLLSALEQHGYTLALLPHPNLQEQIKLFTPNPMVTILGSNTEYKKVFAESSLILTDYSSAIFDFAYLQKPVIYSQFDAEEFFAGDHMYVKGYFDYERDGFGEVESDLEGTVDRIIEYMENGCQLKDKYRERVDNFFLYHDQNNCQRVYEKIAEINTRDC